MVNCKPRRCPACSIKATSVAASAAASWFNRNIYEQINEKVLNKIMYFEIIALPPKQVSNSQVCQTRDWKNLGMTCMKSKKEKFKKTPFVDIDITSQLKEWN
jgi:hypothetical protein